MTDIALNFDPAAQTADIALVDGDLATDDGLMTALIVSIFTDARARPDDVLPEPGADPRGWWGDAFNEDPNDAIGSRLWLLRREKLTAATALKARDMITEALDWLVQDGVVRELTVATEIIRPDALRASVTLSRPDGPARQRFDFVWDATQRSLAA
ncbi:phage GP46 family protein [Sphingomonas sp. AOB5]|uniref:phage GP46 family protein n=1 Tax=Sphingomonas sp. AOB5 TaxID=3034017 RepID=UPI0023F62C5E|nr:phage GP46 family protein [Sphingomonas sp. AOB5]MDF7777834.1 phage GP46 family protein [Sphingomonas sp. AOB5]